MESMLHTLPLMELGDNQEPQISTSDDDEFVAARRAELRFKYMNDPSRIRTPKQPPLLLKFHNRLCCSHHSFRAALLCQLTN